MKFRLVFVAWIFFALQALAAVTVSVNGTNHTIPQTNERGWGNAVTAWIQAISTYTLQPTGGNFTLTADANFGATYGLKSAYFSSRTANTATSGLLRLANTETISWRNAAASGNLPLTVNASDQLTFNGVVIASSTGTLFQDSTTQFYDNSDNTKLLKFELSGITTGTTRTLTVPDANTTLVGTDATQTLTNKTISGASNTITNVSLTSGVTGTLPVANGGTGLTSGTSGGVLAYTAAGTLASSGALTANQLVIGGGAGAAPSTLAAGSQYQSLVMGASNPSYGAVALDQAAAVTGVLPVANGGTNKNSWSQYSIPFAASTSALGEDNTNFTWDDSTDRLFVGAATSMNGKLNVANTSGSYGGLNISSTDAYAAQILSQGVNPTINLTHAVNSASYGASVNLNMSRGTIASRSQTLSGDRVGYIMANGFDNAGAFGTVGLANIEFYAAGDTTTTSQPGEIRFSTTPSSTVTPKERLRLKSDGALEFAGNTSGYVAIKPAATTTSHTLTLPSAQGSANSILTNDGSGNLSWGTSSTPTQSAAYEITNLGIATSVGSSALTISLKQSDGSTDPASGSGAVKIGFRSSTLTSGSYAQRSVTSALSLTISSGSTLGHASALNNNIYVYAIDNAGTVELAVSSALFKSTSRVSTTAEGGAGAADSGRVIYSATARTNVAARLIAVLISNQTTAGTYAAVPSDIQLISDPSFVTPQVSVRYSTNAGQSIPNNSSTTVDFEDKTFALNGSQSAVTTGGSWVFTAPIAGVYRVAASVYFTGGGGWAAGEYATLRVFKNGSVYGNLHEVVQQAAHTSAVGTTGSTDVSCAAGDTISIQILQNSGGALALESDGNYNFVSISLQEWTN